MSATQIVARPSRRHNIQRGIRLLVPFRPAAWSTAGRSSVVGADQARTSGTVVVENQGAPVARLRTYEVARAQRRLHGDARTNSIRCSIRDNDRVPYDAAKTSAGSIPRHLGERHHDQSVDPRRRTCMSSRLRQGGVPNSKKLSYGSAAPATGASSPGELFKIR